MNTIMATSVQKTTWKQQNQRRKSLTPHASQRQRRTITAGMNPFSD